MELAHDQMDGSFFLLEVQPGQLTVILLGNRACLKDVVAKLTGIVRCVQHQKGQKEHSLVAALQILQEFFRFTAVGSKVRWNDVHVVSGTDCFFLFLDLAAVQVGKRYLEELLTVLNLKDRRNHLPSQLSGGQQQRVAIGRALITRPSLILADEPTGNLDSQNSSEVIALLKETSKKYEQTIIMITHNRSIAQTADRVLQVSDGTLTDFGRCRE